MGKTELIFCADGNQRFAEIAIGAGFTYGAQLPRTVYFTPQFVDQNWKAPNLERYVQAVAKWRPRMATVLDWERREQLPEILAWAETIAAYTETVIIIPKVVSGIHLLPRAIGGKPIRLGYSVPTKFSGTPVALSEFVGWPTHLLGGSPKRQIYLSAFLNVISADGNYAQMMATRYNEFWNGQKWQELSDYGKVEKDAPYEAFRRSCENIMRMWELAA